MFKSNSAEYGVDTETDFMSSLFSDETEDYRYPSEPDAGRKVFIRLRMQKGKDCRVQLLTGERTAIGMYKIRVSDMFEWYEAQFVCPGEPVSYCFLIELGARSVLYSKKGAEWLTSGMWIDPKYNFRFTPGFRTPDWAKGALQYQIFTDRFRNGDPANDTVSGEYSYDGEQIAHVDDWYAEPSDGDYRRFYGGDLQGVLDKLDYLQSLGVEVIYFNPLFVSPSSHKYDTQDYSHIDPHFGVITADLDCPLADGDLNNLHASQYMIRTTADRNLEASDALFAALCGEIHRRGMKIILDGVFNHCGSFHRWMDREGIYQNTWSTDPGAYRSPASRYGSYFIYKEHGNDGYEGWWGHKTLPKLNYEGSPELFDRIIDTACRWASPPYSIDGWRLDVAADLGQSESFNHSFWKEFRRRLKEVNPDLLIVAEHYGNPSAWLKGDEWDTVMNYDAFMEPVTYFLTGMEKHSDSLRDDLYQNGEAFFDMMERGMARFEWQSLLCAMNELSNHDHSRFLTRTNRRVGRLQTKGSAAAKDGIDRRVFKEAVTIQMTWPGAPTIYYADEAGQVGWTDPDNRRTYPWGREDHELVAFHREIAALRKQHKVLRKGSFKPLAAGIGVIAYARFSDSDTVVTACNNNDGELALALRLRDAGASDGTAFRAALSTADGSASCPSPAPFVVTNGLLHITLPPRTAVILTKA